MKEPDLHGTDPRLLAHFLEVDDAPRRLWTPDELGAILRHQLATPVQLDLEAAGSAFRARLDDLSAGDQPGKLTFEELFHLAVPPVALLDLVKQFAKSSRVRGDSVLPAEIATVVYLTSIVVARLRCGKRISEQSDESLLYGIQWVIDQPWVDERTRAFFRAAHQKYARRP
jgi:hypothetical protein